MSGLRQKTQVNLGNSQAQVGLQRVASGAAARQDSAGTLSRGLEMANTVTGFFNSLGRNAEAAMEKKAEDEVTGLRQMHKRKATEQAQSLYADFTEKRLNEFDPATDDLGEMAREFYESEVGSGSGVQFFDDLLADNFNKYVSNDLVNARVAKVEKIRERELNATASTLTGEFAANQVDADKINDYVNQVIELNPALTEGKASAWVFQQLSTAASKTGRNGLARYSTLLHTPLDDSGQSFAEKFPTEARNLEVQAHNNYIGQTTHETAQQYTAATEDIAALSQADDLNGLVDVMERLELIRDRHGSGQMFDNAANAVMKEVGKVQHRLAVYSAFETQFTDPTSVAYVSPEDYDAHYTNYLRKQGLLNFDDPQAMEQLSMRLERAVQTQGYIPKSVSNALTFAVMDQTRPEQQVSAIQVLSHMPDNVSSEILAGNTAASTLMDMVDDLPTRSPEEITSLLSTLPEIRERMNMPWSDFAPGFWDAIKNTDGRYANPVQNFLFSDESRFLARDRPNLATQIGELLGEDGDSVFRIDKDGEIPGLAESIFKTKLAQIEASGDPKVYLDTVIQEVAAELSQHLVARPVTEGGWFDDREVILERRKSFNNYDYTKPGHGGGYETRTPPVSNFQNPYTGEEENPMENLRQSSEELRMMLGGDVHFMAGEDSPSGAYNIYRSEGGEPYPVMIQPGVETTFKTSTSAVEDVGNWFKGIFTGEGSDPSRETFVFPDDPADLPAFLNNLPERYQLPPGMSYEPVKRNGIVQHYKIVAYPHLRSLPEGDPLQEYYDNQDLDHLPQ